MKDHLPSAFKTPARDDRAGLDAGLLPKALIVLFLAVFVLVIISPDLVASVEIRNGARRAAFIGLFVVLAIVRLLRQESGGFSRVELLVLWFLAIALISILNNGRYVSSGLATLAGFVGMYLMAFHLTTSSRPARTIALWTWSLLAVFASVVLISLCLTLRNSGAYFGFRFQGITANPNFLGSIAALLMTGAIARSLERGASYRLGWLLLAGVGGVCLFLTQSRTAILASVAGLLGVALLRRSWMFLLGVVLVLGLYAAAKSSTTSISLGEYVELDIGVREVGFESRTAVWLEQLAVWLEEPWLGQGLQVDTISGRGRKGGEGAYFDLLGSVGILGTVPLLLFWLSAATRLVRWAGRIEGGREQHADGYHLASAGIVIALLVHAIGEGYLAGLSEEEIVYFWIVLGAACKLPPAKSPSPEDEKLPVRKRVVQRAIVPV